MSSGAKQTIYNLCMAVLDPGDEAVIPAPFWVSYPDMVLLADGLPVTPDCKAAQGYKLTPRQLEAVDHAEDAPAADQLARAIRRAPRTRAPSGARWRTCW